MNDSQVVEFDVDDVKLFKLALNKAIRQDKQVFGWKGQEWFVPYAKYVEECLDNHAGVTSHVVN